MSNLAEYQYPPPKNWQSFESLCLDLWKEIWNDPNTQKNGRSGQEQQGTDVFGQPNQNDEWAGVQCKGKDNYSKKTVTKKELLEEIEKAKKFKPSLSYWTIATTGHRDAKIQQKAREISEEHSKSGLFKISVWCWEDILEEVVKYPHLVRKHLLVMPFPTDEFDKKFSDIESNLNKTQEEQKEYIREQSEGVVAQVSNRINGLQDSLLESSLDTEYNADIDYSVKLIKENKFQSAIDYLKNLKQRIWLKASDKVKYRILSNLGAAHYNWSKIEDAAPYYIEAHQYNSDDEKSLINLALAYSSLSDYEKVEEYIQQILDKNPSNLNAYAILLQIPPNKDSLEKALQAVPDKYKNKAVIAFCIGLSAQSEGKYQEALKWFEKAAENDTENQLDAKAYLAVMLLQNFWKPSSPAIFGHPSDEEQKDLKRAIKLLDDSWERIKDTDLAKVNYIWLLNRGIAKKILNDIDGAYEDIKSAYTINPDDAECAKHFALISLRKDKIQDAIESLEKHKENKSNPEISSILADIYFKNGEPEKAITVIEDFLSWNNDKTLKFVSYRHLLDIYISQEDRKNANIYLQRILEEFPKSIATLLFTARVARLNKDVDKTKQLLSEAKDLITSDSYVVDIGELGEEFFNHEMYKEAAECFEFFTDISQESYFTLTLLVNYYRAGILSKALKICTEIRDKYGILPKYTEIEIGILEEINDLEASRKLAKEYLTKYPDYIPVQLRLARINLLLGNFAEVDEFLSANFDAVNLSLEDGSTISSLLSQREKVEESFELMYELRRKYYNNAEVHSFYISNFFLREKKDNDWLKSDVVRPDFAVSVRWNDDKSEWFLIEDRKNANPQNREFDTKHFIVQKLLGKRLGEKIEVTDSFDGVREAAIVEIKHKYIYALHKTLAEYETMFPERGDFSTVNVKKQNSNDENDIDIDKFRRILKDRSDYVKNVIDLYSSNVSTVGFVAKFLGKSAHETWAYLLTSRNIQTFCSAGNPKELKQAVEFLSQEKTPTLVADITSIQIARYLKVENKIVEHFGKLLIAPTTLFSLYRQLDELERHKDSGLLNISEDDGVLYRNETSPEEVSNHIKYFQDLIKWIKENCEISPYLTGFDIDRERKSQMRDALMPEFYDTALIVKDDNYALFTEDGKFGSLSQNEYGLQRVWMQPVLLVLKNSELISEEEYIEAEISLCKTNLFHIQFDERVLLKAARNADWLPDVTYKVLVNRLGSERTEKKSAVAVFINFLFELDQLPVTPLKSEALVIPILNSLVVNGSRDKTINLIKNAIKQKFRFLPIHRDNLLSFVSDWEKTQIVI